MDDSSEDQKGWSVYDSIKGSTNQSSIHSDGDAHEDLSIKGIQVGRCPSDPEGLDEARSFNEAHRDRDAIKIQQDAGDLEWMQEMDVRMLARQWYITILAMLGLFVSVIVRELCIANDADDFEGNVKCGEKAPHVQFFKASCSALTAFQVYLMLKQMELKTEHADTKESLRRRSRGLLLQNSKSSSDGLAQRMLRFLGLNGRLIFVLLPLNIIHPVPGLSFIVSVEQLGVVTSYRVESLILAVMLFRVYHVFVLYKLRLLATLLCLDATLIIRNDSTIRQLNDPRMSKPQLAFKIALHRQPFTIILILWVTIILTATWAIRVFEMNTSQSFSTYVWDQMWMIIVTSTTTGYGDMTPKTHFGRFVASLCMLMGSLLMGLMTATLSRNISLNEREALLMKTLDKDKMEATCLLNSVRIIQSWVRGRLRYFAAKRSGANIIICMCAEYSDAERLKRQALLYQLMDTKQLLRCCRAQETSKERTASGMDVKGSPSNDENQWRKTFMGMHQKMHASILELTTQVQTFKQNANMQNKSMERIEEALVSLTAQLSALPSASDVPSRLQRSRVRMNERSCSPSIPKAPKAPQHRLEAGSEESAYTPTEDEEQQEARRKGREHLQARAQLRQLQDKLKRAAEAGPASAELGLVTTRSAFQGPSSNSRHLLDEQQNRLLQRRSHDVEQQQHQQPYLGQHSEEMMGGNRNFPPPSMKGKDDSLPASKMGGNSLPIGGKGTPLSRLPSTKATPRASSNAPAKERSIPEYQQQRDPASLPRRR